MVTRSYLWKFDWTIILFSGVAGLGTRDGLPCLLQEAAEWGGTDQQWGWNEGLVEWLNVQQDSTQILLRKRGWRLVRGVGLGSWCLWYRCDVSMWWRVHCLCTWWAGANTMGRESGVPTGGMPSRLLSSSDFGGAKVIRNVCAHGGGNWWKALVEYNEHRESMATTT